MNVAFFANDLSAGQAAMLADSALNRRDGPVIAFWDGAGRIAHDIPAYLDAGRAAGADATIALPLSHLGDPSIRERIDLAVVTFGRDALAEEGALRAIASDHAEGMGAASPAWMLGRRHRQGRSVSDRTLPVDMKSLTPDEMGSLRAGCSCGTLRRRAIALAATLRVAADNPFATDLGPAAIVRAIAAGTVEAGATAREMELRADLLDLVTDLDETDGEDVVRIAPVAVARPSRRTGRRDRRPVRGGSQAASPVATRHAPGCAWVASR